MSSVFEKITLYDFFGYLIPGITFETIICALWLLSEYVGTSVGILESLPEINGYIYVVYFLLGYFFGLLISEIARWICNGVDACRRHRYKKALENQMAPAQTCPIARAQNKADKSGKQRHSSMPYFVKVKHDVKIQDAVIWKALINSGLVGKDETMPDSSSNVNLIEKYFKLMFSNIQADEKYKRIHDYASYSTMCKNLSLAVLLAGMISLMRLYRTCDLLETVLIALACLAVSCVLFVRYGRFEVKKGVYTVAWFVAKNSDNAKNEHEKTGNDKNKK